MGRRVSKPVLPSRWLVHTNFTNTAVVVHAFDLAHLAEPANLDVLGKVFTDPAALKPGETTEAITREVAERFKELAEPRSSGYRRAEVNLAKACQVKQEMVHEPLTRSIRRV